MNKLVLVATVLILSLLSTVVLANGKPPRDGKPPEEAFKACVDKYEGEVVTFETRHGHQLEATCKLIEQQLVAVPEHHKNK